MNSFTDTPAAMASFFCTLNEISDGRAVLGIGPGDLSTLPKLAIQAEKPVARLEEAVTQIRKLCAGEEVKKSGMQFFDYDGAKLTGVISRARKASRSTSVHRDPRSLILQEELETVH
jgi:5,10-methylenetetrahydromethanopterin reductase